MTISYTDKVSSSKGFSVFLKLLLRWKGSIYKLIWKDLIIFLFLFYALNLTYRFGLDEDSKLVFERVAKYCKEFYSLIPLAFVLGFYVTLVMTRWWDQFLSIPFPDNLAILISANIPQQDENGRLIRRTIARYLCLAFAVTMSLRSPKVKKRFPTMNHFVEAGLMTSEECKIWEDLENEYPGYAKYWLPLAWAANVVTKARQEGVITNDMAVRSLLQDLNVYRGKCGTLLDYDWINIPLVYTQVVTLAVHFYFLTTLIAQQYVDKSIDLYFPFLPVLEYFFYMGWLKVAETLINPFGEDDDDFETNWLIDRNVLITYLIVDKIHHNNPKLMKDQYWHRMAPTRLPYTFATEQYAEECPVASTDGMVIKKEDAGFLFDVGDKNEIRKRRGGLFKRVSRKNDKSSKSFGMKEEVIDMASFRNNEINHDNRTNLSMRDNTDFDRLKATRLSSKKQKLKRAISLLRNQNLAEDEEERLLTELLSNSEALG